MSYDVQEILATLNGGADHPALRILPWHEQWTDTPKNFSNVLSDRGDLSAHAVYLELFLNLTDENGMNGGTHYYGSKSTLCIENDQYHLAGPDLDRFTEVQNKLLAFGILKNTAQAHLVINKTIRSYAGKEDAIRYTAHLGINAADVDSRRLLELRACADRSIEAISLMNRLFDVGARDSSCYLVAPATEYERLQLRYSEIGLDRITRNSRYIALAGETLGSKNELYSALPHGVLSVRNAFARAGHDTGPGAYKCEFAINAEDPNLLTKLHKIVAIKSSRNYKALIPPAQTIR